MFFFAFHNASTDRLCFDANNVFVNEADARTAYAAGVEQYCSSFVALCFVDGFVGSVVCQTGPEPRPNTPHPDALSLGAALDILSTAPTWHHHHPHVGWCADEALQAVAQRADGEAWATPLGISWNVATTASGAFAARPTSFVLGVRDSRTWLFMTATPIVHLRRANEPLAWIFNDTQTDMTFRVVPVPLNDHDPFEVRDLAVAAANEARRFSRDNCRPANAEVCGTFLALSLGLRHWFALRGTTKTAPPRFIDVEQYRRAIITASTRNQTRLCE